jgi:hypothetical protein
MARGRRAAAALRVYEYLQRRPIATIDAVSEGIGMSRPTVGKVLGQTDQWAPGLVLRSPLFHRP